jgi:hypothetical protein
VPGFFGSSWEIRVFDAGVVELATERQNHRRSRLSKQLLEKLKEAMRSVRFFELDSEHMAPTDDSQQYSLSVGFHGKHHAVRVWGPEQLCHDPQVERFLELWSLVVDVTRFRVACNLGDCQPCG